MDFILTIEQGKLKLIPIYNPFAIPDVKLPRLKVVKNYWESNKNGRKRK